MERTIVGATTDRAIDAVPLRNCASWIEAGRVFDPGAVAAGTAYWNEKTPSPAVASPLLPSSKKAWVEEPPIEERSVETVRPVLVGFVPGVTETVSRTDWPASTRDGLAAPVPLGFVGPPHTLVGEAVLRGVGAPAEKSAALLSVSVQPPAARIAAVV